MNESGIDHNFARNFNLLFLKLRTMKSVIILLSLVMRAADVTAGIEAGYSNIRQDTVAGPTVLECGSVPTWINGEFGCNPIRSGFS